jgi:glycosyltransferase involved in cell wall biosynthesis
VKILAISWASCGSFNREIFRSLSKKNDVKIKVIIPKMFSASLSLAECDSCDNENIDIVSLKIKGSNSRYNYYSGVYSVLSDFNPDIVYYEDDPIGVQAIQYGIWCYFNKKKFVCRTVQNTSIEFKDEIKRLGMFKGVIYTALKMVVYKITTKLVDHVFTINNDGLNICKDLGFKSVSKIPLGMDKNIFKISKVSGDIVRKKLALDGMVFSYIGRMIEGKGVHILLEALAKIKQYKWTLILDNFEIYGKSNYHHKIRKLITQLDLKDRIIFFNADHNEISGYMNAANVVIVPSITTLSFKEQYGRVAPESMACGCLVITSDSGALPELVDRFGWIFEEGDAEELARLLVKAINLDSVHDIGRDASKYAHQFLSVNAQAKAMINIFRELNV